MSEMGFLFVMQLCLLFLQTCSHTSGLAAVPIESFFQDEKSILQRYEVNAEALLKDADPMMVQDVDMESLRGYVLNPLIGAREPSA